MKFKPVFFELVFAWQKIYNYEKDNFVSSMHMHTCLRLCTDAATNASGSATISAKDDDNHEKETTRPVNTN